VLAWETSSADHRSHLLLWLLSRSSVAAVVAAAAAADAQVVQPDKFTLTLRLRTPLSQGWLHLSWHPTAARLCMGRPPARGDVSEGFALAQQVRQIQPRCCCTGQPDAV
jgi:hypothetical protein